MKNPKASVDALTACGERAGEIVLHELTLGRVALLERIGSPFAERGVDVSELGVNDILPVVYIMQSPVAKVMAEIRDGTFDDAVIAFADGIPLDNMKPFVDAIGRIFKRLDDVAPQGAPEADGGSDEGNAGAATDGS